MHLCFNCVGRLLLDGKYRHIGKTLLLDFYRSLQSREIKWLSNALEEQNSEDGEGHRRHWIQKSFAWVYVDNGFLNFAAKIGMGLGQDISREKLGRPELETPSCGLAGAGTGSKGWNGALGNVGNVGQAAWSHPRGPATTNFWLQFIGIVFFNCSENHCGNNKGFRRQRVCN